MFLSEGYANNTSYGKHAENISVYSKMAEMFIHCLVLYLPFEIM